MSPAYTKEGYLRSYIIIPSTIYNRPANPLVEAGFQKTVSIQIPALIKASIARGQGGVVGKGVSIWPSVDVEEGRCPNLDISFSASH